MVTEKNEVGDNEKIKNHCLSSQNLNIGVSFIDHIDFKNVRRRYTDTCVCVCMNVCMYVLSPLL